MILRRGIITAVFLFSTLVIAEQHPVTESVSEPNSVTIAEQPVDLSVTDRPASNSGKNNTVVDQKFSSLTRLKSASPAASPANVGSGYRSGIGSGVVAANPLSVVAGLLVVVALIFVVAWLMRRVGGMQMLTGQSMKVVSALSVGSREKVLLINVGDKQLLIGVAPGRVSKLHYFDEAVITASVASGRGSGNDFSSTIKKVLQKNKQTATAQTGSKQ